MDVIGPRTARTILSKVVFPTCVISRVYAYHRADPDTTVCVLHIVSDDGQHNTIVRHLYEQASEDVGLAFLDENAYDIKRLSWRLDVSDEAVPEQAQTLFVRPGPDADKDL